MKVGDMVISIVDFEYLENQYVPCGSIGRIFEVFEDECLCMFGKHRNVIIPYKDIRKVLCRNKKFGIVKPNEHFIFYGCSAGMTGNNPIIYKTVPYLDKEIVLCETRLVSSGEYLGSIPLTKKYFDLNVVVIEPNVSAGVCCKDKPKEKDYSDQYSIVNCSFNKLNVNAKDGSVVPKHVVCVLRVNSANYGRLTIKEMSSVNYDDGDVFDFKTGCDVAYNRAIKKLHEFFEKQMAKQKNDEKYTLCFRI
ncbi:MAG: hypothetical protein EOL93_01745 [Epsilonproteobacteria bacterium]|nr:hypothetical protein [Campylobacterota bacterium]